jgi:membrane fusion protein, multidrug efflux system
VDRMRKLRTENMVSQSDLDTAEATVKQTQANADAIAAVIEKKTIRAPFAGRLGIRLINLGQYLDVGKPIVSLQSLTPVYADFSLPQQELARLKTGMKVRLQTDAYPDQTFEGALSAINPDLDSSTRSVGIQATFTNAEQLLRPGMFARVEVLLPHEENVLVIPQTAVLSAPYGDSVYVIESKAGADKGAPELTVRQQFVRTGRSRGDLLSVESGLKAGERIVSAGVFKLRNGMGVAESNEAAPKTSATPRPSDS